MKISREVTIYDIAQAVNLSPSTVSRALKDHPHISRETKKKIRTMANKLGYQRNKFASNLRLKHTNTIGVVVPRLNSYFMATVLAGIEKVTSENGFGLIISQTQESFQKEVSCVSTLFNSRVDGLLVSLSAESETLDHFKIFLKKGIPLVFFDRVAVCQGSTSIVIDNYRAGYEAVSHLIEQGCRRISYLGGSQSLNVYSERLRGYRQALIDHGCDPDPELIFNSDMSSQSGIETAKKILKMKKRPDGIFTANDTTAVAIITELKKSGIGIPQEIAVVGFNNEPVSQIIEPNLSTIDYPAFDIGVIASTSLISYLRNTHSASLDTIVLKHKLLTRESSVRNLS